MSGGRWWLRAALALSAYALMACSPSDDASDGGARGPDAGAPNGSSGATAESCDDVRRPTECPDPPVVYADVEPIFMERCIICHNGMPGGPWGLTSYSHVRDWYAEIRARMVDCQMPPPDAGVPMTAREREEILTWILCGALE